MVDAENVSRESLFARVDGMIETRSLFEKRVVVFGLGSGGSEIVLRLSRCGVDTWTLVDFDRVEVENVSRHVCDLGDVGKLKTGAVAERIRRVNPHAVVETVETDICKEPWIVDRVLEGAALGIVCTGGNVAPFVVNRAAVRLGVPVVYAGAYERAFGGHVLRCIPGQTPCYECVVGGLVARMGPLPEPRKGRVPYIDAEAEKEFVAEPGLGIDAGLLWLIAAKMALLTLLRGSGSTLPDFPSDLVFWGNQKWWIFPEPLFAQFASTSYREDCTACRGGRPVNDSDDE
jgi:molybdopterin/thiamine biosynthesis adenylyltransferase